MPHTDMTELTFPRVRPSECVSVSWHELAYQRLWAVTRVLNTDIIPSGMCLVVICDSLFFYSYVYICDGSMCLVLALKEATQTPLLALDEFDVFMDERNRRVSLEILQKVRVCV